MENILLDNDVSELFIVNQEQNQVIIFLLVSQPLIPNLDNIEQYIHSDNKDNHVWCVNVLKKTKMDIVI